MVQGDDMSEIVIYEDGDFALHATVRNFRIVQIEGKRKQEQCANNAHCSCDTSSYDG